MQQLLNGVALLAPQLITASADCLWVFLSQSGCHWGAEVLRELDKAVVGGGYTPQWVYRACVEKRAGTRVLVSSVTIVGLHPTKIRPNQSQFFVEVSLRTVLQKSSPALLPFAAKYCHVLPRGWRVMRPSRLKVCQCGWFVIWSAKAQKLRYQSGTNVVFLAMVTIQRGWLETRHVFRHAYRHWKSHGRGNEQSTRTGSGSG